MNTILIVEDDETFRDLLRTVFETRGFNVLIAANTGEAMELAACHALDAVLADYHMPKTDGVQLCRVLSRQVAPVGQQLPMWIMTGSIDLSARAALAAGALAVFHKPFRPAEVAAAIELHLRPAQQRPTLLAPTPRASR